MGGPVTSLWTWVLDVSGLDTTGGVDMGGEASGGSATTITAPTVTPSGAPALVVSAVGSCKSVGGVASPFLALTPQGGNGAAYDIATTPGPLGPVFQNPQGGGWNVSVADFR